MKICLFNFVLILFYMTQDKLWSISAWSTATWLIIIFGKKLFASTNDPFKIMHRQHRIFKALLTQIQSWCSLHDVEYGIMLESAAGFHILYHMWYCCFTSSPYVISYIQILNGTVSAHRLVIGFCILARNSRSFYK